MAPRFFCDATMAGVIGGSATSLTWTSAGDGTFACHRVRNRNGLRLGERLQCRGRAADVDRWLRGLYHLASIRLPRSRSL